MIPDVLKEYNYFPVFRRILDDPLWQNSPPEHKTVMIVCLLLVNQKEKEWIWKGEKFTVKPGQFITSLDSLKKACGKGVTIQNIRTALLSFEKLKFLTNESTKTGRLISLCNFKKYKEILDLLNKHSNNQLTKTQQRPNIDLTPTNNKEERIKEVIIVLNEQKYVSGALDAKNTEGWVDKMLTTFPDINHSKEIMKADAWVYANPQKQKKNYRQFLNNWFSNTKNKLDDIPSKPDPKPPSIKCPGCGKMVHSLIESTGECIDCN